MCLFCPDNNIPKYSRFLTRIIDPHHIQGRARSQWKIPACRYHHTLITQNKIPRQTIVDKANEYYGEEIFYLPHPESKHIKIKEDAGKEQSSFKSVNQTST